MSLSKWIKRHIRKPLKIDEDAIHKKLLHELTTEREYQHAKWGLHHDDNHKLNDWIAIITTYLGRAACSPEDSRDHLFAAASVALAAVESYERNKIFDPICVGEFVTDDSDNNKTTENSDGDS